jgi:uncharacterized protein YyaL (SSP411 family)
MIRTGGWPLTIVMTPDRRPFFAATYLPKYGTGAMAGLMEVVPRLSELWASQRELVESTADKVSTILRADQPSQSSAFDASVLQEGVDELSARYDEINGGFGTRPKFPSPHTILYLLARWRRTGDPSPLTMATTTLDKMRRGGIHDLVGGGFHRYATDSAWLVPHFEKMLYDQAMHIMAYAEGYRATGRQEYLDTAIRTAHYVLSDLSSPEGAFYAAEDADSPGGEGAFYTWGHAELQELLGGALWPLARDLFGITPKGNYVDEAHGGTTGRNIIHLERDMGSIAELHGIDHDTCSDLVGDIVAAMARARQARVRPHRDEKVLADWNGLMVAALSRLHVASGEKWALEAAEKCASYILAHLAHSGSLHHVSCGSTCIEGTIDDYAFVAWGLLELYEASFNARWLKEAAPLIEHAFEHFWDDGKGGFFTSSDRALDLIARQKPVYDGAVPSGNSAMLLVLARAGGLLSLHGHEGAVSAILDAFYEQVSAAPSSHAWFLLGADIVLGPGMSVAVTGTDKTAVQALVAAFRSSYAPHAVIAAATGVPDPSIPLLEQRQTTQRGVAHICGDAACHPPTSDPSELAKTIDGLYPRHKGGGNHIPITGGVAPKEERT